MSTLDTDSNVAHFIGYQVIVGLGLGILLTTGFFPVLAPLPVKYNANALAFFMFVRWFSQVSMTGKLQTSFSVLVIDLGCHSRRHSPAE